MIYMSVVGVPALIFAYKYIGTVGRLASVIFETYMSAIEIQWFDGCRRSVLLLQSNQNGRYCSMPLIIIGTFRRWP